MKSTFAAASLLSEPDHYYVIPPVGNYVASGDAADVYQVDQHFVIKQPMFFPEHYIYRAGSTHNHLERDKSCKRQIMQETNHARDKSCKRQIMQETNHARDKSCKRQIMQETNHARD